AAEPNAQFAGQYGDSLHARVRRLGHLWCAARRCGRQFLGGARHRRGAHPRAGAAGAPGVPGWRAAVEGTSAQPLRHHRRDDAAGHLSHPRAWQVRARAGAASRPRGPLYRRPRDPRHRYGPM
ncbi:MAG: hypothetical protein AVDCRST_MAG88-1913, partial [uncultured Thermomicrobiales bacterium]